MRVCTEFLSRCLHKPSTRQILDYDAHKFFVNNCHLWLFPNGLYVTVINYAGHTTRTLNDFELMKKINVAVSLPKGGIPLFNKPVTMRQKINAPTNQSSSSLIHPLVNGRVVLGPRLLKN